MVPNYVICMISKAIVMAAGKGTRMLPLTKEIPKPLIKVNSRPFLDYLIENLVGAGFSQIGIVGGYRIEKLREYIKGLDYDAEFTIIEQKEQKGTADALISAKDFAGDDSFVALGGDNLWSVADLKRIAKEDEDIYIAGVVVEEPEHFGVLLSDASGEYLDEISEKPRSFVGNLINTGLYKFTPEIFDALGKVSLSERGEMELTDALTLLAKDKKVKIMKLNDYWVDFGKLEDIPGVERFLREVL